MGGSGVVWDCGCGERFLEADFSKLSDQELVEAEKEGCE
jgi:hypothetical protein